MDILDILLDILLKPPQPFIGLFLLLLLLKVKKFQTIHYLIKFLYIFHILQQYPQEVKNLSILYFRLKMSSFL